MSRSRVGATTAHSGMSAAVCRQTGERGAGRTHESSAPSWDEVTDLEIGDLIFIGSIRAGWAWRDSRRAASLPVVSRRLSRREPSKVIRQGRAARRQPGRTPVPRPVRPGPGSLTPKRAPALSGRSGGRRGGAAGSAASPAWPWPGDRAGAGAGGPGDQIDRQHRHHEPGGRGDVHRGRTVGVRFAAHRHGDAANALLRAHRQRRRRHSHAVPHSDRGVSAIGRHGRIVLFAAGRNSSSRDDIASILTQAWDDMLHGVVRAPPQGLGSFTTLPNARLRQAI